MHCLRCQSAMEKTEEVIEQRTHQSWYRCPLCTHQQTVSEYLQLRPSSWFIQGDEMEQIEPA